MLEAILRFSILQRMLVVSITVFVSAFGAYSLNKLPIDAVPDITNKQVQINTQIAGLSPLEIEKQVTFAIETALTGIPGLEYTRSMSRNGFSQVTAVFADNLDVYFARQQVSERLSEARENLPVGADPKMGPISTGLGEVFMWSVEFDHPEGKGAEKKDGEPGWQSDGSYLTPEGEKLSTSLERASYLRTLQDWVIRPQVKGVRGVAGVDAIGGYVKQYQVKPDPGKLVSFGLTFDEIIEALEKNNLSVGPGYVERNDEAFLVRVDGRIENAEQIANVVVAVRQGVPVYIRDLGTAGIGKELRTGAASKNGEEVVIGTALMLLGENSRSVASAVNDKMTTVNRGLPPGIQAKTVLNRTKLVDATIRTVRNNLTEGAILVVVVLFFLLGNIRAAVVTALAIPCSMLLTAIGMIQLKMSGNLMSLGAVDFGLIVDGAVIIVENCLRRLAEKQHELHRTLTLRERLSEVMIATREMIKPSVYGQAIIIIVYLPILTLTGVEGKMFSPMAMTVILALISAFVLSMTFIPAMVGIFVSGRVEEKEIRIVKMAKDFYRPCLEYSLQNRNKVIIAAVVAFALSLGLFTTLGQEFVPSLDEKDVAMHAMRIPSTSLNQSALMQTKVEKLVAKFPEVAFIFSKTGTAEVATDPMPPNVSDTFIILKPREEWPDSSELKENLIARMEKALGELPGNNFEFTQPIQMRFNELIAGVRSDVAVKVFGDDFESMQVTAKQVAKELQKVKGAADVKVEQTEGLPVLSIVIDRAILSRYALSVAEVQDVISVAIGGKEAGNVYEGDKRFDIIIRLDDEIRTNIESLKTIPVPLRHSEGGKQNFIPLSELAKIEISEGPNQISRENGKRRVVVQANVRGSDLGSFVSEAQQRVNNNVKVKTGQWLEWGGQFENLTTARRTLSFVVPLCFLLIFSLLYKAFNSARDALLVFSGVPLAMTGGILSLWLRGMPFSISAAVGFIALSGVAVLNGLVMISFVKSLRQNGMAIDEAIFQGCFTRLRPILMTALVASLGFVPMAIGTGTGAEVQRPLATVVIGGLISSTLLTLVVLPALYRLFAWKEEKSPLDEAIEI